MSARENYSEHMRKLNTRSSARLVNRLITAKSLPTFAGDAFGGFPFKEAYELSSEVGGYNKKKNIARILSALRGPAPDVASTLRATSQDATDLMNIPELHFANKKIVAANIIKDLKSLPDIESGKLSLMRFAIKKKQAMLTFKSLRLIGHPYTAEIVDIIGSKIPPALKFLYNKYVCEEPEDKCDLEKLSDFLYLKPN